MRDVFVQKWGTQRVKNAKNREDIIGSAIVSVLLSVTLFIILIVR